MRTPATGASSRARWRRVALATVLVGACQSPAPTDPWERGMAAALAQRAAEHSAAGDAEAASEMAREALALAQRSGDDRALGLAHGVLGRLDGDIARLALARDLLVEHGSRPEAWATRLDLAAALIAARDFPAALAEFDVVVEQAEDHPQPAVRAPAEAAARRMRSTVLRGLERLAEARADDRRAQLVLSMLPDGEQQPLRLALALVLGEDALTEERPVEAHALLTRARTTARALGDLPGEARALAGQARALAAQGRFRDAAARALIAAEHALEAGDATGAHRLALDGLAWLDDAGEPLDAPRRSTLRALVARLDGAP